MASAVEVYCQAILVHHKGRKEARRMSSGDSGVDSSGVLQIAVAHESVLSVQRRATIKLSGAIVNLVPVCSSSSLPGT